jgi:flagellar hook-associated protein 1 FlgK
MLDIGKMALYANTRALNVVSHNIANINTPGFSRQEALLTTATPVLGKGGMIGRGVVFLGIRRSYESYIQSQLLSQHQNYGRSYSLKETYGRIEQIFNEAKDYGLSKSLNDYFNAWHEVATNPESSPQRVVLLQKAHALVNSTKKIEQDLLDNVRYINDELDNLAVRINKIASDIATLNDKILQIEAGGTGTANDFRDKRQLLMNELGELVDFISYEDDFGSITIMVGMRNLVYQTRANELSTRLNENGDKDLYLDGLNITGYIEKGRVSGLLEARQDIRNDIQTKFRRLIASLIKEINIQHRQGFGLDASTGNDFFGPLSLSYKDFSAGADITAAAITDDTALTLDEYDITFDAANNYFVTNRSTGTVAATGLYSSGTPITFEGISITITGAITPTDRFFASPLTNAIRNFQVVLTDPKRIAASSTNTELPANNVNAQAIVALSQNTIGNLGNLTFANYYRGIISEVASFASASRDSYSFEENLLMEISNRRESISGVSLDEEAVNMIKFQRAYEASARMIKVTDELLQTILNL